MSVFASILLWAGWSYFDGGILAILMDPQSPSGDKLAAIRAFFERWGSASPLIYVAVVTVEVVVAPIPGTLLYLPGGVIFGGFTGGTLSLTGNVLGAGIACQLMRSLIGREWIESMIQTRGLEAYRASIQRYGFVIVALLRLNPLTSSDLVSYAAGLTTVRVATVMLGTCAGMAPLCYAQAYLAEGLFEMFPWLIWPLIAACVVYAVVVVIGIRRLACKPGPRPPAA